MQGNAGRRRLLLIFRSKYHIILIRTKHVQKDRAKLSKLLKNDDTKL